MFGALMAGVGLATQGVAMYQMINDMTKSNDEEEKSSTVASKSGGNGSAGEVDEGAFGGQMSHLGAEPSEGSLGRPIALEQDPVLEQPVDNSNNFIF